MTNMVKTEEKGEKKEKKIGNLEAPKKTKSSIYLSCEIHPILMFVMATMSS